MASTSWCTWQAVSIAIGRKSPRGGHPTGPIVTLAREAIAIPDQKNGRIQLHMSDETTHESAVDEVKGEKGIHTFSPREDMALDPRKIINTFAPSTGSASIAASHRVWAPVGILLR